MVQTEICPFCGKYPKIRIHNDNFTGDELMDVACPNSHLGVWNYPRTEAVNEWNKCVREWKN